MDGLYHHAIRAVCRLIMTVLLGLSVWAAQTDAKQSSKSMSQRHAEHLRTLVIIDRTYELGEKIQLAFAKNESARLRCADNPCGLQEILIGWVSGEQFGVPGDLLDTRFISDKGKVYGGGSFLPRGKGFLRQYRETPCLAIARYDLDDGELAIRFRMQTDPVENRRAFEENLKTVGISLQQRGDWKTLTGTDGMPAPKLTVHERVARFVRLWSEVKYNFVYFDQVPDLDWDQVLEDFLPRVMEEQSFHDYYRLLQRCVAQLQDGHTGVWPVSRPATDGPPLLIRAVEGKAIVAGLGTAEEIKKSELIQGDEITHVDGRSVQELLEQEVYPYIFASTRQVRSLKAYGKILEGPKDSPVNIRIGSLDGGTLDVTLTRRSEWKQKPWDPASEF